eukprot:3481833-Rhodomonas_salina.1
MTEQSIRGSQTCCFGAQFLALSQKRTTKRVDRAKRVNRAQKRVQRAVFSLHSKPAAQCRGLPHTSRPAHLKTPPRSASRSSPRGLSRQFPSPQLPQPRNSLRSSQPVHRQPDCARSLSPIGPASRLNVLLRGLVEGRRLGLWSVNVREEVKAEADLGDQISDGEDADLLGETQGA